MNVFGIGLPEMAVIAAVALLVFGPKRLPEFGRTLGKTLKGFQSASKEFEREINKAMADPESVPDQAKVLEAPAETVVSPAVTPKSEPKSPSD
jgi:sec-independent protein translocase protein TatA